MLQEQATASTEVDADDGWEWMLVEALGHRRHYGRVREEERYGAKLLRIDVPQKGDPDAHGWQTHYYAAAALYGREVDPGERDIADALVWSCPVCPAPWCRHDPVTGAAIGAPAGEATRDARARTRADQVERLIAEATRDCPGARGIAEERITAFLAHALGLAPADAVLDRMGIPQLRDAYRVLRAADYRDVVRHAQTYRGRTGRAA